MTTREFIAAMVNACPVEGERLVTFKELEMGRFAAWCLYSRCRKHILFASQVETYFFLKRGIIVRRFVL